MRKISNNVFLLSIIIFSCLWASYLILDKMQYEDVPRMIPENQDYTKKFLFAIDGLTSFGEEILFGMVSPAISCFAMVDFLRRIEKNEPKRKASNN